jgi:hypothetical protein
MKLEYGEYYGKKMWRAVELDELRRTDCLCRNCDLLDKDPEKNCPHAQVLYALCQSVGMAIPVSRCALFVPRQPA